MTDIVVTAANVVAGSNATRTSGTAGTAIAAGQTVYFDTTVNKWLLAQSTSVVAGANHVGGIALNSASLNQPVNVQTSGDITIGGTLVAGSAYFLSTTPGGITLVAGVTTGDAVCELGLAKSATVLSLVIQFPGVTL
jgi:hypothetical protein